VEDDLDFTELLAKRRGRRGERARWAEQERARIQRRISPFWSLFGSEPEVRDLNTSPDQDPWVRALWGALGPRAI